MIGLNASAFPLLYYDGMKWYGWKNTLLRIDNLILYISGCFMVGSGLLLQYRMPPRHGRGPVLYSLGLDRHEWGDLHFYFGLVMIAATLAHLFLNWAWLTKIAASRKAWRLFLGLGFGIGIILFFWVIPIEEQLQEPMLQGFGRGFGGH